MSPERATQRDRNIYVQMSYILSLWRFVQVAEVDNDGLPPSIIIVRRIAFRSLKHRDLNLGLRRRIKYPVTHHNLNVVAVLFQKIMCQLP
jgi:hypothetical protein